MAEDAFNVRMDTSELRVFVEKTVAGLVVAEKRIVARVAEQAEIGMKNLAPTSRDNYRYVRGQGFEKVSGGHYKEMIKADITNGGLGAQIYSDVEYSIFVELDTRPHHIAPKSGGRLLWKGSRGIGSAGAGGVNHPGTKGQHVAGLAAEEVGVKAEQIANEELKKLIGGA